MSSHLSSSVNQRHAVLSSSTQRTLYTEYTDTLDEA